MLPAKTRAPGLFSCFLVFLRPASEERKPRGLLLLLFGAGGQHFVRAKVCTGVRHRHETPDTSRPPRQTKGAHQPSAGAAASLKLRASLPCTRRAEAARKPCAVALAAVGTCAGAAPAAALSDTRPPTALTTLRIMVSL